MTGEPFGAMLRRLRVSAGMSQNALGHQTGIDPAYVNRMERAGERTRSGRRIAVYVPSRAIVCELSQTLKLGPALTDRLLYAAGLAPQVDWQTRAITAEVKLAAIGEALAATDADVEAEPSFIRRRTG